MNDEEKYIFLKAFIKNEKAIDELLVYTKNKFIPKKDHTFPSYEDLYLNTWKDYYQDSKQIGVFEALKKHIVQLQFPVEEGISKTEAYRNVTLRGQSKSSLNTSQLVLYQPEGISLDIYKTDLIGEVPVMIVPNNDDFNTVVCALSNKNEPQGLPKSMGASFINGLNNWDRIERLKADWLKENPVGNWSLHFKEHILPKPYLFKDKVMVLSTKPYSGVDYKVLNISEDSWKFSSLKIRRAHECAHLFTLKQYGCMANNMHDEIVADYVGITEVLGNFNREWFLHFIGLEDYPKYRKGGRLENYQGPNQLSIEAFEGLKMIIKNVSETIYTFDILLGKIKSSRDKIDRIKSICEVDLITMASSKGLQALTERYNSKYLASIL